MFSPTDEEGETTTDMCDFLCHFIDCGHIFLIRPHPTEIYYSTQPSQAPNRVTEKPKKEMGK